METGGPKILGVDVLWVATILAGLSAMAVMFAVYAATTVRDPMVKRVKALQETSDRLGTPEFQFFVITIAIQRETGGNLAETLANLADVLRKRSQMKLKIKAMSSESKASALIIGALPFIVFGLVWFINNNYMAKFFQDDRLIVAGGGGMVWMAIGAWIMAKMINFEI